MRPFLVEPPSGVLVPWTGTNGLAAHCVLETNDERQGLVESYERAAVAYLDGYTGRLGRCILRQKWAIPLSGQPELVYLPFPDCRQMTVERDDGDAWVAITGAELNLSQGLVEVKSVPDDAEDPHLTFWAGWQTAAEVPEDIKQAVRFLVAHWFDNRSGADGTALSDHHVPMAVEAMISPLAYMSV